MTYGLYRRVYRAIMPPRPPWRWIVTGCLVIGALVLVTLGDPVTLGWGLPIVFFGVFWLWVAPEMIAWTVSRRDPRPEPVTGDATAERLRTTTRFGTLEFPWDSFVRVVRTDSIVLLVQPVGIAQVFAREFFDTTDDFTRFGEWALAGRRPSK